MIDIYQEYVHLARLALLRKEGDIIALLKRDSKTFSKYRPELASSLKQLIKEFNGTIDITRQTVNEPLPVDIDSKLELLKREAFIFDQEPVWPNNVMQILDSIIQEREFEDKLIELDLAPTRTILFVGPPGVGKTYAARWLSSKLKRPLLTLDLAAVMSSFLGRTGNNLRAVLDYAQKINSILLLDEFDAIAKRRDDDSEVGELKRLVNVLLQAIDDWPSKGLLIAATNHPELLDPAVWRRFEKTINFPNPSVSQINSTLKELILGFDFGGLEDLLESLSIVLEGSTFAEIVRITNNAKRESVVKQIPLNIILENVIGELGKKLPKESKILVAKNLSNQKYSQRKVAELIGLSRDTIRKYVKGENIEEER